MRKMIGAALALATGIAPHVAQAAPVAIHYDVRGNDYVYGPPGNLGFSFDLYFDPTLLGSVTDNGGTAVNGYYFYSPTPSSTYYVNPGVAVSGPFTNVTASIGQIPLYDAQQFPGLYQNTLLLNVYATGINNTSAFTALFIKPDGTVVNNNFYAGVDVYTDTTSHISEYQIVQLSAVPEASTWAMMMVGIGAVGGLLRQARRQKNQTFRLA